MERLDFDRIFDRACETIDIYNGHDVFQQSLGGVDSSAALLYAAVFCESEICNGGFRQFFSNSTGVLAPEAIEAFSRLGMPETAALIRQACERVGNPYPRERTERKAILGGLDFDDLDERFYRLLREENGGFEAATQRFIDQLCP